ncbi:hypothetical protein RUM43_003012 [Polyplax serrata]|uniref:SURF1-like protein n=1 Tax=Polyplax serrata TaxID=468196 RepID=A0AAN8S2Y1_POLSC
MFARQTDFLSKPDLLLNKRNKNYKINASGSWFLLIIPVSAFALGTWQVKRKIGKEEQIKKLKEVTKSDIVELPANLDDVKNMEFHPVKVKGKFDHTKEIYLGPRTLIKESYRGSSLISTDIGGYCVITPFTLTDRNLTILVNRGWVPNKLKSPSTRMKGQVTEEVEIIGLLRGSEKRQPLGMKNMPEKGFWLYRDLEKMSEVTGAYPILIDANLTSSHPNGPIGGQTIVTLHNNHLTYIMTWYGLCAVTSYMWYLRFIKGAVK